MRTAAMNRTVRHLLIAMALLFAQQAAQLHALVHVRHHLALSDFGDKEAPPPGPPAAQCLAFHAVDSALPSLGLALGPAPLPQPQAVHFVLPIPLVARTQFDSRAPPALS